MTTITTILIFLYYKWKARNWIEMFVNMKKKNDQRKKKNKKPKKIVPLSGHKELHKINLQQNQSKSQTTASNYKGNDKGNYRILMEVLDLSIVIYLDLVAKINFNKL